MRMTRVRFLGKNTENWVFAAIQGSLQAVGISACSSGVKSHTEVPHVLCKGIISVLRIQHCLKDKVTTINHHLMSYKSKQDIFP